MWKQTTKNVNCTIFHEISYYPKNEQLYIAHIILPQIVKPHEIATSHHMRYNKPKWHLLESNSSFLTWSWIDGSWSARFLARHSSGLWVEANKGNVLENETLSIRTVISLSKRRLTTGEISLLWKGLEFTPTSSEINSTKPKLEFRPFDYMRWFQWHLKSYEKETNLNQCKRKSERNTKNKERQIK